jgi:hypothetical protein
VANVVRAVLHQEALAAKLWLGLLFGDFVDDAAGNRFYQYDMEQAKSRLVKEGYACLKINKYNRGLREALH